MIIIICYFTGVVAYYVTNRKTQKNYVSYMVQCPFVYVWFGIS